MGFQMLAAQLISFTYGKEIMFKEAYVSSQRRTNVFGQSGHERGCVCLVEGPPGFLVRCGGSGMRASEWLGWLVAAKISVSPKLGSENGGGDTGGARLSGEMLIPVLLTEEL